MAGLALVFGMGDPVLSENSNETISCGFSKIVTQQTAESFPPMDRAFGGKLRKLGPDDFVLQALMVSLGVIMQIEF